MIYKCDIDLTSQRFVHNESYKVTVLKKPLLESLAFKVKLLMKKILKQDPIFVGTLG